MLTRILTAVIGLIVFIGILLLGDTAFQIAIGLVILCMIYELFGAITKSRAVKTLGFLNGIILMAGIYFKGIEIALISVILLNMIFMIFLHGKIKYSEILSGTTMSVYVVLFMSYILRLKTEMGISAMALVFIISWGSDTAAYFCGTFFGKHKLIEKVSPKKTIVGSVGAVVITGLLCMGYLYIMGRFDNAFNSPDASMYINIAITGVVVSALSQFGDLAASAIKRDCNIKDYGSVFPGHGGFMDRFDSVIFIAPVVYYLCKFIIM